MGSAARRRGRKVMPLPTFETERLIVRRIEEGDAEGFHAAYGDPEAMRFWNFPAQRSIAETVASIKWARRGGNIRHGVWAIIQRCGGFVGMINYHGRETRNRHLELGWIVVRAYWRQGIMTEAAQPVLEYCFTRLKTHRIEALIEPENIASRALAARLGFIREGGLLRDRLCVEGAFRSVLMYSLLYPDWLRLTTAGGSGHA
jgi:[ribosomal protein S5]-alanine N-acetyltransferase